MNSRLAVYTSGLGAGERDIERIPGYMIIVLYFLCLCLFLSTTPHTEMENHTPHTGATRRRRKLSLGEEMNECETHVMPSRAGLLSGLYFFHVLARFD